MLLAYWVMAGPYWKYGSYPFLGFLGTVGLCVALTNSNLRQWLGWLVLMSAILLGYATFDSRKRHDEMRNRVRQEVETRVLNERLTEASPAHEQATR